MKVPSTKVQNNFGKYLKIASELEDIIVTRKGKDIAVISAYPERTFVGEEAVSYYPGYDGNISYEEFKKLADNSDLRFEYIDGKIFYLASPSYSHQSIVDEIYGHFYNWFKDKK